MTSACPLIVVVSVAKLLAGLASATPEGRKPDAVLIKVPVASVFTSALTVYVTVLPPDRLRVSSMLPVPDRVNPAAPPVPVAV